MAIQYEQGAVARVGSGQSRTATAVFQRPTKPNSLLFCTATSSGGSAALIGPAGFTLIRERVIGDLKLAVWYCEAAPPAETVTVQTTVDKSLQIQVVEYSGVALAGALDKVSIQTNQSQQATTGTTDPTSQPDALVLSAVCNLYGSTQQSGFSGALTNLLNTVTPQSGWGWLGLGSDPDYLQTRLTLSQGIVNAVQQFAFSVILSALRPWIAIICTFKGGTSGPARFTSRGQKALTVGGRGDLSAFGRFTSVRQDLPGWTPALRVAGQAWMGPFEGQYRLGGRQGLLIGEGTPYRVESVSGLDGWEMRVGDEEQPRDDGSNRGVDLQSSRQILFRINAGDGDPHETRQLLDVLYRALVPQKTDDWEMYWRDPGQALRMIRVRPISLVRELTWEQMLRLDQQFALRAADPRHYSAFTRSRTVPVTPAGAATPTTVLVLNEGSGFAYPVIRITPQVPISRVEVRNETLDVSFAAEAAIPARSTLIADMEARAIGSNRSVITVDGQPRYGAWVSPRRKFVLGAGANNLSVTTVPAGAPVTCTIDYRDTWAG